ncbi:MAG: S1 RNA-binding domain-containing protein [Ardenticatenaceae bacterium]|nr:S1 RNA-binding domain-containing protein [Ardenticatenaceae bacterium]MCB9445151.1 S1 RNA-binding domain-containing protein [Ardenticatenaceae bacterium]
MSPDNSINSHIGQSLDDSYWQALFAQEESVAELIVFPDPEDLFCSENGQSSQTHHTVETLPRKDKNPWQTAQTIFDDDETLELPVTGYNKGGLLVYWNGLQGFVPASQLTDFPQFHFEVERTRALKNWLHKTLKLKIVELNAKTNRLIFSERAAGVTAKDREQLFEEICPGDHLDGVITNLTNFGAFVDLGGAEGLIHISELSWSRVIHPSDIVQPGQSVSVMVMNVDREQDRIALSLKRLKADPWHNVEKRYKPGQLVTGVVNNIVNFGAFVQLEDELEGLIHISELAEGSFLHPRNVVQKGQEVTTRILTVDGPAKRLALSLRLNGDSFEP